MSDKKHEVTVSFNDNLAIVSSKSTKNIISYEYINDGSNITVTHKIAGCWLIINIGKDNSFIVNSDLTVSSETFTVLAHVVVLYLPNDQYSLYTHSCMLIYQGLRQEHITDCFINGKPSLRLLTFADSGRYFDLHTCSFFNHLSEDLKHIACANGSVYDIADSHTVAISDTLDLTICKFNNNHFADFIHGGEKVYRSINGGTKLIRCNI